MADRTYVGADNGLYGTATNWSPADVPNTAAERAVIDSGRTVLLDTSPTVGGLRLGAGSTLTRSSTANLTYKLSAGADTTFTNEGTIASGSATVASGTLTVAFTNGIYRNSGTFLVSSGTSLVLGGSNSGGNIFTNDNAGGIIQVASNGLFRVKGSATSPSVILGGNLLVDEGGAFDETASYSGGAYLDSVTFTNNGVTSFVNPSSGNANHLTLAGGTMVNNGVLQRALGDSTGSVGPYIFVKAGETVYNNGSLIVTNQRTSVANNVHTYVRVEDGLLVNDGTIFITGPNLCYSNNGLTYATGGTTLRFSGSTPQWLNGTGTVEITSTASDASLTPANDYSGITAGVGGTSHMNIGTDQTVVASGTGACVIREQSTSSNQIWTNLINWGTITVDTGTGGSLQISAYSTVHNLGTLVVTNSGRLLFMPQVGTQVRSITNSGLFWVQSGAVATNAFRFTQLDGTTRVDGLMVSTNAVFSIAGGTLAGAGEIRSPGITVTNGATLAPGGSVGQLTVSNLTLAAGAKLAFELGPTAASDCVLDNGTLRLNGQQWSDFSLLPQSGFGEGTYVLIDAMNVSGTLGGEVSGSIAKGLLNYPATLMIDSDAQNLILMVRPASNGTLIRVQ